MENLNDDLRKAREFLIVAEMDKIESYLTELSNQIKTRYPESIIQSSFSQDGELGDVVMKIYLPNEVDAELATAITNRTLDILLEADVLIATLWNDSGQTWKKLSKTSTPNLI